MFILHVALYAVTKELRIESIARSEQVKYVSELLRFVCTVIIQYVAVKVCQLFMNKF